MISSARTDLRLAWGHQRWELLILLGACLVYATLSVILAWRREIAGDALFACMRRVVGDDFATCRAESELANMMLAWAMILLPIASVTPFLVGLFLGPPIIAREIEHHTASVAWSLSPSRVRWLVQRVIPVVVLVALTLLLVGYASELLALATSQEDALGFPHFAMHGPLLMVRGVAVLAIGIAVGLVVGRTLPALLLTGGLAVALVLGLTVGRDALVKAEGVPVPLGQQSSLDSIPFDSGYRVDATGEILSWEAVYRQYPEELNIGEEVPGLTPIWYVVPAEQYPWFVAREAGALLVLTLAVGGLTVWLVGSRRPD